MKRLITIIMLLTLPLSLSACGVKRDLKLPSEIQKKEQKKQDRMQTEGGNI